MGMTSPTYLTDRSLLLFKVINYPKIKHDSEVRMKKGPQNMFIVVYN